MIVASVEGNTITLTCSVPGPTGLGVWIDPRLVDIKEEIEVVLDGNSVFKGRVEGRLDVLIESAGRRDPEYLTAYRIDLP